LRSVTKLSSTVPSANTCIVWAAHITTSSELQFAYEIEEGDVVDGG
jgi:hypothetical protein